MKKPEKLIGFIQYDGTDFPFEFEEATFSIKLFPPTIKDWNQRSSPGNLWSIFEKDSKTHEWIGEKRLQGITSERYNIIFSVLDSPSNCHGFYSYQANWYFCFTNGLNPEQIDGFKISGAEVNYFFPPYQALKSDFQFDDTGKYIKEMSVSAVRRVIQPCGKYRVAPHVDANISVEAYATMHPLTATNPIDAISIMVTAFTRPIGLDILVDAYYYSKCFLEYITYRKNISACVADVFWFNEEGKRNYQGILVFKNNIAHEDNKKADKYVIQFSLLQKKAAKIFALIKNNKLDLQYLCASIEDTHHYPTSRIIMILAEFEREYRNIYGQDSIRSPGYILVKNEIIDLIGTYANSKHGDDRRYAKQLRKYVENRDNSFEDNLKNALLDCKEIMLPFIQYNYDGEYESIVATLSSRMGEVRNGIAHSRLDLQFDAIHLSDIKIVEELVYAIRLKKLRLRNQEIRQGIKSLFGENISIT